MIWMRGLMEKFATVSIGLNNLHIFVKNKYIMATLSLSGGDPGKKVTPVDACSSGACPPKRKSKISLSTAFNPNKPKYNISKSTPSGKSEDEETPEVGAHMNMNNLSGAPGDVKLNLNSNKKSFTGSQNAQGKILEKGAAKMREMFKKNK